MTAPALLPPSFEAVFNAAPGNYLLLDRDFQIVGVTDAYLKATMTVRDAITGRGLFEVFPDNPEDPSADGVRNLHASLRRVLRERRPDRMPIQKYDIRRPEAEGGGFEERYWSPLNTPVLAPNGEVQYVLHWVEDVTEFVRLKQQMEHEQELMHEELRARASKIEAEAFLRIEAVEANKKLAESERRYRFLTDAVPQLIWSADAHGNFDYCNERWTAFTGLPREALLGDGWRNAIHPDDLARTVAAWNDAVREGPPRFQLEHRLRHHDGAWRWVLMVALPDRDATGRVRKWLGTTTDIHERVVAEEQIREAQRLQSVGKLAGGMAHEVNNMMAAVLGFGDLVLAALGPEHALRSDVEEMIKAGARAALVSRQLLAFSRQQVLQPVVLDVNTVISGLSPMLRQMLGSDRRFDITPAYYPVRVVADRGQIEQVLINLVANARDATSTNGVIAIETEAVQLDRQMLEQLGAPELDPGRYVHLTVRDDGIGMSPDVAARIFEPFFTTKGTGQGTGLGMSMVYGIIKQSGGSIRVESAPGAGTAINIYLPFSEAEVAPQVPTAAAPRGRGERILVVEDETVVRSLARRALERSGYVVYQAPNGAAALDFLIAHPNDIDLVLSDMVMPNLNGRQLAEQIAQHFPALPIIFMTGYSGDDLVQRGLVLSGIPVVSKPFTIAELAAVVRGRLDRR